MGKGGRMYHSGWDKHGDIIQISGGWITARLDGDKGSGCWEVDAPYIKILATANSTKKQGNLTKKQGGDDV